MREGWPSRRKGREGSLKIASSTVDQIESSIRWNEETLFSASLRSMPCPLLSLIIQVSPWDLWQVWSIPVARGIIFFSPESRIYRMRRLSVESNKLKRSCRTYNQCLVSNWFLARRSHPLFAGGVNCTRYCRKGFKLWRGTWLSIPRKPAVSTTLSTIFLIRSNLRTRGWRKMQEL